MGKLSDGLHRGARKMNTAFISRDEKGEGEKNAFSLNDTTGEPNRL
jgi:hypothetical protein